MQISRFIYLVYLSKLRMSQSVINIYKIGKPLLLFSCDLLCAEYWSTKPTSIMTTNQEISLILEKLEKKIIYCFILSLRGCTYSQLRIIIQMGNQQQSFQGDQDSRPKYQIGRIKNKYLVIDILVYTDSDNLMMERLFMTCKMSRTLLVTNQNIILQLCEHRFETIMVSNILDLVTRDLRFKNINLNISNVKALSQYAKNTHAASRITEINGMYNFVNFLLNGDEEYHDSFQVIDKLKKLKKISVSIKTSSYDYSAICEKFHHYLTYTILEMYPLSNDYLPKVISFSPSRYLKVLDIDCQASSIQNVSQVLQTGILVLEKMILRIAELEDICFLSGDLVQYQQVKKVHQIKTQVYIVTNLAIADDAEKGQVYACLSQFDMQLIKNIFSQRSGARTKMQKLISYNCVLKVKQLKDKQQKKLSLRLQRMYFKFWPSFYCLQVFIQIMSYNFIIKFRFSSGYVEITILVLNRVLAEGEDIVEVYKYKLDAVLNNIFLIYNPINLDVEPSDTIQNVNSEFPLRLREVVQVQRVNLSARAGQQLPLDVIHNRRADEHGL